MTSIQATTLATKGIIKAGLILCFNVCCNKKDKVNYFVPAWGGWLGGEQRTWEGGLHGGGIDVGTLKIT